MFAFVITGVIALVIERPFDVVWTGRSIFAVVWPGLLGSGLAYCLFRTTPVMGRHRTSLVAYLLPVVGIAAGRSCSMRSWMPVCSPGRRSSLRGVALVNNRFGQRRIFGRTPRGRPARRSPRLRAGAGAASPQGEMARSTAPRTTSPAAPIRATASRRPLDREAEGAPCRGDHDPRLPERSNAASGAEYANRMSR